MEVRSYRGINDLRIAKSRVKCRRRLKIRSVHRVVDHVPLELALYPYIDPTVGCVLVTAQRDRGRRESPVPKTMLQY